MKKLFKSSLAIILGLSLTFAGCKKEESTSTDNNTNNNGTGGTVIPETQKSTLFYFGGTWCPPCGAYGKPAKEKIHNEIPDKAVIISCQIGNDPMKCADGTALQGMFNATSVPAMYFGAADQPFATMVGGSSGTSAHAVAKVNEQFALKPIVNSVLTLKEADGLINVTAEGKFFQDAAGEYYIAGYLLEDKLNYAQVSDASVEKNIHYNVIRTKFGTSLTGELLKADPKKGDTFTKQLNFFVQSTYVKANLGVAVVIWKKGAAGWSVSNSSYIHFK
jgi:hypothetical protein